MEAIVEKFFHTGSDFAVNVEGVHKQELFQNIQDGKIDQGLFEVLQSQMIHNLSDTWFRYIITPDYKIIQEKIKRVEQM